MGRVLFFYQSFIGEFDWNRATIATADSAPPVSRGLSRPFVRPLWDRYGPKRFKLTLSKLTYVIYVLNMTLPII